MNLLPFEIINYSTKLSKENIIEKLYRNVGPISIFTLLSTNKLYCGKIINNKFKITKNYLFSNLFNFVNTFNPIIFGNINFTDNKSIVTIYLRPFFINTLFFFILFLLGLILSIITFYLVFIETNEILLSIISLIIILLSSWIILLMIYLIIVLFFNLENKNIKNEFKNLLNTEEILIEKINIKKILKIITKGVIFA